MVSLDEANRSGRVWSSSLMYLSSWSIGFCFEIIQLGLLSSCCKWIHTFYCTEECSWLFCKCYRHSETCTFSYRMKFSHADRKFLSYLSYCCKLTVTAVWSSMHDRIRNTVWNSLVLRFIGWVQCCHTLIFSGELLASISFSLLTSC